MKEGLTPRGTPMPQTLEEWRHLASLYEAKMLLDKNLISDLKHRLHNAEQKLRRGIKS